MQESPEDCHEPELVGEPLRLELNFRLALEHITAVIVLGERKYSAAVDNLDVISKTLYTDKTALRQMIRNPLLKYLYIGSFYCDLIPNFPRDFSQLSTRKPVEHRRTIASFAMTFVFPILFFLGRKLYTFIRRHYTQMILECNSFPACASTARFNQIFSPQFRIRRKYWSPLYYCTLSLSNYI